MNPIIKIIIEAGPLVAFFLGNWLAGIFWGTGIFMAATVIALLLSWLLTRKLAVMPLISAGFVAVFGILTLWLHDETFIKVKVTLINALFGDSARRFALWTDFPQICHGRSHQDDRGGLARAHHTLGNFLFSSP